MSSCGTLKTVLNALVPCGGIRTMSAASAGCMVKTSSFLLPATRLSEFGRQVPVTNPACTRSRRRLEPRMSSRDRAPHVLSVSPAQSAGLYFGLLGSTGAGRARRAKCACSSSGRPFGGVSHPTRKRARDSETQRRLRTRDWRTPAGAQRLAVVLDGRRAE